MFDVWGKHDVIELLECALKMAKEQHWGYVAFAMVGHPAWVATGDGGDVYLQNLAHNAVEVLHNQIGKQIQNANFPDQDPNLDLSFVRYNMCRDPLGFDFLTWVITQEMNRVRAGAEGPLKVGFWHGLGNNQINKDTRARWLDNVFRPLLPLFGFVEDDRAIYGHQDETFVPHKLVTNVRAGEPIPRLKNVGPSPFPWRYITITLRESKSDPERNSNLGAWTHFASYVMNHGGRVVFVRDTCVADEPLPGYFTYPLASKNIHDRVALYEGATHNFFVENGPGGLALYGRAPCTIFCPSVESKNPGRGWKAEHWEKAFAIKVGEQFPWTLPTQRLVWKADTYENILSAYEGEAPCRVALSR